MPGTNIHGVPSVTLVPPRYAERCPSYGLHRLDCAAPATAVPFNPLVNQTKQGIASFLQNNANYSTFLSIVQSDPTYSKLLTGAWTQVRTQACIHYS